MRPFYILLLLLIVIHKVEAHSQDHEHASPKSKSRITALADLGERMLDHLTFTTPKGIWAIYPAGGYSSRTGLEFGLMPVYTWDSPNRQQADREVNTLTSSMQFSTKGMVEVRSELNWYVSPQWQFMGRIEALRINDRFWDRWSQNKAALPFDFRSNRYGLKTELLRQIGHQFHAGVSAEIWHYEFINQNENLPFEQLTGSDGGWLAGAGPVFLIDRRDHVLYPRSGSYFKASWTLFQQGAPGAYGYNNYLLDFRHFLGMGRTVLAFQSLWEYSDTGTPFYMLPQLGGKDRLRGIGHSKSVVDHSAWLLRSEFRAPLWWRFGAVVFSEVGQSAAQPNFNWNELIYSNGIGLRFRILPHEPLNIRIDAGWSSEGHQGLFISLKEAF